MKRKDIIKLIEQRTLAAADMVIERDMTIRQIAKVLGVSKQTVSTDLSRRLPNIDGIRYNKVSNILKRHKKNAVYKANRASLLSKYEKRMKRRFGDNFTAFRERCDKCLFKSICGFMELPNCMECANMDHLSTNKNLVYRKLLCSKCKALDFHRPKCAFIPHKGGESDA